MPSETDKQARFMAMCSSETGRTLAKRRGVKCPSIEVAREFTNADKRSGKLKEAFRSRAGKKEK